jgi:intracellular sulfur oxidation DsrE/DsrF family protein
MKNAVVLVTRLGFGTTDADDADFGLDMLDKFFHTLESRPEKPRAVCFYTEGVKLLQPGSPIELSLKLLEKVGIDLYACQSCLDYYQIEGEIVAGKRSNMVEIVQLISDADKVITV